MDPTTQHIHGWGAEPWAELRTTGKTEHRRYSQGLSHQHLKTRPTICYLKHNLPPELQVLLFFLVLLRFFFFFFNLHDTLPGNHQLWFRYIIVCFSTTVPMLRSQNTVYKRFENQCNLARWSFQLYSRIRNVSMRLSFSSLWITSENVSHRHVSHREIVKSPGGRSAPPSLPILSEFICHFMR